MTTYGNIREKMRSDRSGKTLFEAAKTYAFHYMDTVSDRRVFPAQSAIDGLDAFDGPFPEKPSDPEQLLRLLHECGSPATVAQTGGRYFGFVNGNAVPAALAAKWLSDVWDQNPAVYVISPIVARIESVCERWLRDLFGLPQDTVAGFVSGTSVATLSGLAAGRNVLLKRCGWDVHRKGLFSAPKIRVILGDQAHASVIKALSILGFGSESVERVPVDGQGRMDADRMPALDGRCLVIAQAGNVCTGAFDPFEPICDRAAGAGAWIHIDGAFGLWAAGSGAKEHLTRGIERADSWSVDAHKTLNAPYDCGIVLSRHPAALLAAMQASDTYIQYSGKRDGMMYTPEMSRRARAVELWATLKFLGKSGVAELVDGLCDRAKQFAERLDAEGFLVLNEVVFNQVLVSCDTPEETHATLKKIQQSGECWCGGAVWEGRPVIRISVCSWATTPEDIDRSAEAFITARDAVRAKI